MGLDGPRVYLPPVVVQFNLYIIRTWKFYEISNPDTASADFYRELETWPVYSGKRIVG